MIKKCITILILLLVCAPVYALEDDEEIVYNLSQSLVGSEYIVKYANLVNLEPDEQDNIWVVAVKEIDNMYFTKMFVYTVLDEQYPLLWESEEIRGYFVRTAPFFQKEQRYIWIDISRSDLNTNEIWIYRWNGAQTNKLNPLDAENNILIADGSFACWDMEDDGEYEFMALLDSEKMVAIYVLRDDKLVLKEKRPMKPHIMFDQTPASEKYPEIAKMLEGKYSSYILKSVYTFDYDKNIELCGLENKENPEEKKLVVLQASGTVKKIWYELPQEYTEYLYMYAYAEDFNHDGNIEILFLDALFQDKPGIYILSIQPEGHKVVVPLDENGQTFYYTDIFEFGDYNNDGYRDLLMYIYSEEIYLYWNPETHQLEESR